MPVLTKTTGGTAEITKPNGRGVWHVHVVDTMRHPMSESLDEVFDEQTGERQYVHVGTHLTINVRFKQQHIPCTYECFKEALDNNYHRAAMKRFFLYRRVKKVRVQGKDQRQVGPVSLISVCENASYLRGSFPMSASQYAMKFLVNTKDGGVIISALHFAFTPVQTETIASGLAAKTLIKEGDQVAGNPDLYVAKISKAGDDVYEVEVRSKKEDQTENDLRSRSFLTA